MRLPQGIRDCKMHDLIIVGAGPAGITAAIYAARMKLKTLVLTKNIGGQAAWSGGIGNYTGFQYITGLELAGKFEEHMRGFDLELREGVEVECVERDGEHFSVKTKDGQYTSKAVILASGRMPRQLNAKGEEGYKNHGVSYCATCDGPLFQGKDVVVVGGGNSALDAAVQLLNIANRIYLVNNTDHIIGDQLMIETLKSSPKVEIRNKTELREIFGDNFVRGVRLLTDKSKEETLPVEGVFVEIGSLPAKEPACKAKTNEYGEIVVNGRCETDIPGLFAAGDVTSVPEKQIIVACGQGCIASLSAFKYVSRKMFKVDLMTGQKGQVYRCSVCGNVVELVYVGGGTLVCCGKTMELLMEKSEDQGQEKHVPVIEKTASGYRVNVGSVPHPMEDKHYIAFIELVGDGRVYRQYLKPADKPVAEFTISASDVTAREYCNLHGLWRSK